MCRKVRKWQKETHHFAKENKPWLFIAEKQRAEETWTFSKNPGTNQASVFFINLHHSEPERMNAGLKVKGHFVLIQLRFLFFYRIFFIDFFFVLIMCLRLLNSFFFYTVRSESCRWWRSTMSNVLHGQKKVYQTIPCLVTGVLPLSFVAVMCVFLQCEHSVPLKKDIKCTFSGSGKGTKGARFMVSLKWQLKFNKLFLLKVYR